MANRIWAWLQLVACVVCADVAFIIRMESFLLLVVVNGLLAAAWLLMPESDEPSNEE